jgi:PAS domain S-box-containing protein
VYTSQLLQLVLEETPAIAWIVDRDLTLTRMDGAIGELFDSVADRFVGRNLHEIHAVARGAVDPVPHHLRALRGETVRWDSEYRGRAFSNVVAPARDPGGEIVGAIGTCIDVSDARAIERRAREALRVGRMGIIEWNLVTNEMAWSPETYKILGYDPATFTPTLDAVLGMIPVEDRELVQRMRDAAIEGIAAYDIVHRIMRSDGELIYVHAQSEVMRDVAGKPLRMLGTVTDITAHKRTEDALRISEKRLHQTLEAASAVLWSWDLRTDEVRRRLPGSDREEVSTLSGEGRLHPDDRDTVHAAIRSAVAGETPEYRAEFRDNDPVRGERWRIAVGQVERAADGAPIGLVGLSLDITDRKRAELELVAVDRRRSEFIALLSHELRNPLGALRSSLYILQHPKASAADASRAQAVIDRQSRHLVRMVDDLLDVTRISSGKIRLQRSRVDLVDLVRRTVDDHHALIGSRKLDLVLPDRAIRLDADPTRVAQVLENLISNAVKFTTEQGNIAVDLGVHHDGVVLQVSDDGVGIDGATLAQLFKPFMQAERSLDRSPGGLGLGLALVKALVELHGGSVSARSAGHQRGACFTIRFPQQVE